MTNSHDHAAATESAAPTNTPASERSLHYWLRAADSLISRDAAERFDAEGATRRDLRILTALSGATEIPERLRQRMERGGKRLANLAERGWIERANDGWQLTPAGTEAQQRLTALTQQTRDRAAGAVSAEDLATTVATLEAIASEFGWTPDTRLPRRGVRGPHAGRGERGHRYQRDHGGHFGRPEQCTPHGHREHSARGSSRGHGACHGHPEVGLRHEHHRREPDSAQSRHRGCGEPRGHSERAGRNGWDDGHGHGHGPGHGQGLGHEHGRGYGRGHGSARSAGWGPGSGRNCGHDTAERGVGSGCGHPQGRGLGHERGGSHGGGRAAAYERGFAAGYSAAQVPPR